MLSEKEIQLKLLVNQQSTKFNLLKQKQFLIEHLNT